MKKLILLLAIACITISINAAQKIIPGVDTVCCFFYKHYEPSKEDTVVLAPMAIPAGCALVGNWEEVGSAIYTHPHFNQCVNEFCKTKYKKKYTNEYCHVERIDNIIFVIFKNSKGSDLLFTLLNKYKNEKISFDNLLAYFPEK